MKSTQQLIGQRFGRAVVLECAGKDKKRNVLWRLKCDCGTIFVTRGSSLLSGTTKSCGCLVKDRGETWRKNISEAKKTHGFSHDPELKPTWVSWSMMTQRCFNPKRKQYEDYGGRGIKPCAFVAASPANVVSLIGKRHGNLQIDRIENNGGYTCGQCAECQANGWAFNIQWSDRLRQGTNKRNNVRLEYQGESMTRREWSEKLGKTIGWVRHNIG